MVRLLASMLTALALVACGTAEEARVVAKSAHSAAVATGAQLAAFKATRERVARLEIDRVALLARQGAVGDADLELELELAELSDPGSVATYNAILMRAADRATREKAPNVAADALRKRLLAGLQKLNIPTDSLKELSEKLQILSKKESLVERGKFLIAFAKSVKAEMIKAKENRDKALKNMSSSNADAAGAGK